MGVALINTSKPFARKEYECMYCGKTIRRGEQYSRTDFSEDGKVSSAIVCLACDAIELFIVERWEYFGYDMSDGIDSDMFNIGVNKCLVEDLHIPQDVVDAMPVEEKTRNIQERLISLTNAIRKARELDRQNRNRWKYFMDMAIKKKNGELTEEQITKLNSEHDAWKESCHSLKCYAGIDSEGNLILKEGI